MCSSRSENVTTAARGCLQECPISAIRGVACECDEGVIVLRGRVPNYYYKQLSQEAVARIAGVRQVVNNIEVE